MRIIAGSKRGSHLKPPADTRIRPTSDKTRGAIFNILCHNSWSPPLFQGDDIVVADLFCGTGAFAFEALSRGASRALLVDLSKDSLALARENAAHLSFTSLCQFMMADAAHLPPAPLSAHLVFLDPPYDKGLISPALHSLHEKGWLQKGAVLVAETRKKEQFEAPAPFRIMDQRSYGDTGVTFLLYN